MIQKFLYMASITVNPQGVDNLPQNDLDSTNVQELMSIFFGIAAAVAVLVIALSAFRIVISRGNSQDVQKARDAIIYAAIGLAVSLSGFIIVTFVIDKL